MMSRLLLRLLSGILFIWQPMNFAVELTQAIPMLSVRGPLAVAELCIHGLVAALCSAAGWALWHSRPHGPKLGTIALLLMAAMSVQSLYWSVLPRQTMPGTELPLAALATAHAAGWIGFLFWISHDQDDLSNHFA